jgi:hypothetical protein
MEIMVRVGVALSSGALLLLLNLQPLEPLRPVTAIAASGQVPAPVGWQAA